ncbi:hypothetical protein CANCADRAFT_141963 [Tortispora caseinolytica NRRL Y-17796]|uniref:Trm112p-domain-containing protein n=1 Tax=Tortispora caseinolytica NRRL Y-17796 TaxID=767744 RepID=A0A1E4TD45_9ASCO|nr:hypothetical protein CANCADRAFT_141963 [Tortispora caseinolytica NRRL Y-17796]
MKLLTLNFVQCATRDCAGRQDAFPLAPQNVQLAAQETDLDPDFMANILAKIDWPGLETSLNQLGRPLTFTKEQVEQDQNLLKELHSILIETTIQEGELVCPRCSHIYHVKDGIASFLLPPHLV